MTQPCGVSRWHPLMAYVMSLFTKLLSSNGIITICSICLHVFCSPQQYWGGVVTKIFPPVPRWSYSWARGIDFTSLRAKVLRKNLVGISEINIYIETSLERDQATSQEINLISKHYPQTDYPQRITVTSVIVQEREAFLSKQGAILGEGKKRKILATWNF